MSLTIVDKTWPINRPLPEMTKSIFLAGPSPRGDYTDWKGTWREDAIRILQEQGFDGHVFIPLPFSDMSYTDGLAWEEHFLEIADHIVFWVPRSDALPGFTTNVEFGDWMKSGKISLGYPIGAEKTRYLDAKAAKYGFQVNHTLEGTLQHAVSLLGAGARRVEGEVYVPLFLWSNQYFQAWYQAQVQAGNRLVGGRVLWSFKMPIMKKLFCWVYKADVFVTSENRIKSNEFMFTRSDISCVVAYVRAPQLLDTKVITIKEFRVPARTADGFVHELPGGSSFKEGEDVKVVAAHELEEESGLVVDPSRFHVLPFRQLASTLSTHVAHLFTVEITEEEAQSVLGTEHGVEEDTEHTYVGLATFRDILLNREQFDFSMVGMIAAAGMWPQLGPSTANAAATEPKVFLGGTCADSTWREELIPQLRIGYFNPVVKDWTPECQAEEIRQRETCDYVLYVISPLMEGVYSIAEVVDDANNRPKKTIFCVVDNDDRSDARWTKAQRKSLKAVEDLVERRGGRVCKDLAEVAKYLNQKD